MLDFIFYFFAIMAATSSMGVLLARNILYAALLLIVCLLCIAGIYVLLQAEFLAITQILIYAGGILVLLIFGIMLTIKREGTPLVVGHRHLFSGTLVGAGFLFVLSYCFLLFPMEASGKFGQSNNLTEIGISMMSDYVAPFELAGILLLITLVGASMMASVPKR